jgi:hypothetical protein
MALDTELRATTYAGNGSTALAYPILFPYLDPADIKVQVQAAGAATPTVLTESAYTVHDEEDDGAPYVTTTAAYPSTTTVQIFRFMDYLQPVVLPEGGKLSSVIIEQALDRLTMLAMQGGDGGYTLPSAGSRDSVVFANAGARATTVAARVGQLGVQTDNGSVWRALSTFAGDWQEIMPAIRSNERNVHTQSQLIAAFAETAALTIYVRKDIDLSVSITMGPNKTLVMGDYRFTQVGASTLILMGAVVADRRQIFSGFTSGQITGTFGGEVYPEWWGLVDGYHDIAINMAIRAGRLATSNFGIKVSLGPRQYDVSAPIDMASQSCFLEGHGSATTILMSTANWDTAQWLKAEQWGPVDDVLNHAAMVWIGGEPLPSPRFASTYRNQVRGIGINCYAASLAYAGVNPVTRIGTGAKRVSGISSKAGVEECSIIDDVVVSYASGFGIGFCRHRQVGQAFTAATVNGLTISNCWILGPTFRDSVPINFSQWTNNCKLSVTTVDIGVAKSISADYGVAVAGDLSGTGAIIYPLPAWIVTYPLAAIVAQGFVSIEDVHIEGATIGVHVLESSGINNVYVRNVKAYGMMDRARSAVYELDGKSGVPPTNTANYAYSCAVMISGQGEAAANGRFNWKDRVSLHNISVLGLCAYIVRDSMYEVERTSYGMGDAYSRTAGVGGIVSYMRGNAWVDSAAPGSTVWNSPASAPQKAERTYFIGPIH